MGTKKMAEKFNRLDKRTFKGKVGHTRTGACTAKGRCFHGRVRNVKP